jgi:hypothetical protein
MRMKEQHLEFIREQTTYSKLVKRVLRYKLSSINAGRGLDRSRRTPSGSLNIVHPISTRRCQRLRQPHPESQAPILGHVVGRLF